MQSRPMAFDRKGGNIETCVYKNFMHRSAKVAQGTTLKLFRLNSNHGNNNAGMGKYVARNSSGFMNTEQCTFHSCNDAKAV